MIVGDMLLKGRFFGCKEFASFPTSPYTLPE